MQNGRVGRPHSRSAEARSGTSIVAPSDRLEALGLLIAGLSKAWREELDRRLRPLGLTRVQWQALLWLSRAGGALVQRELSDLLEIGAPAIDLLTHDARQASVGHIAVDGVFGFGFLPSLANLLAHRRLSGIFFYGAPKTEPLPDGWPGAGWLAVQRTAEAPVFARGSLQGKAGETLRGVLGRAEGTMPARFLDSATADIEATAAAEIGYIGVLAMFAAHPLARSLLETMRSLPGEAMMLDYPRRVAQALSHGVPIDTEDLKYLYDLELRTWAPTSERSRSQAGYGVF